MQVHQVLEKILKIEEELDGLNARLLDWAEQYQGNDFPEQMDLAVNLENTVQMVTHEMATEIGFTCEHIELLVRFIEFRRRWKQFSDKELSDVLDSDMVPLTVKKQLIMNIGPNAREMIKELRLEWNKLFANKSYSKIQGQFKI